MKNAWFPVLALFLSAIVHAQESFLEDFVEIKSEDHHFYVYKYEVSAGEYHDFFQILNNEILPPENLSSSEAVLPAMVTKEEAESYLAYLSDLYMISFRLPTQTEWQLAAANTPRPKRNKKLHCVDCPNPDQKGLYGMLGNVWEWTSTPDPNDQERYFIIKGGDFQESPKDLSPQTTFVASKDMADMNIGFRPVISASDHSMITAVERANKLIKELWPEKHIEINSRGIFDEGLSYLFDECPETAMSVSVDWKIMEITFCCIEKITWADGNVQAPDKEYVGTVYKFAPDRLPLAKELQQLILRIKRR